MIIHQVFALIKDTIIKNVMVCNNYELANQLARATFGDDTIAVECTQFRIGIGDIYKNGLFYYKDGITLVSKENTAEEDTIVLKQLQSEADLAIAEATIEMAKQSADTDSTIAELTIIIGNLQK